MTSRLLLHLFNNWITTNKLCQPLHSNTHSSFHSIRIVEQFMLFLPNFPVIILHVLLHTYSYFIFPSWMQQENSAESEAEPFKYETSKLALKRHMKDETSWCRCLNMPLRFRNLKLQNNVDGEWSIYTTSQIFKNYSLELLADASGSVPRQDGKRQFHWLIAPSPPPPNTAAGTRPRTSWCNPSPTAMEGRRREREDGKEGRRGREGGREGLREGGRGREGGGGGGGRKEDGGRDGYGAKWWLCRQHQVFVESSGKKGEKTRDRDMERLASALQCDEFRRHGPGAGTAAPGFGSTEFKWCRAQAMPISAPARMSSTRRYEVEWILNAANPRVGERGCLELGTQMRCSSTAPSCKAIWTLQIHL